MRNPADDARGLPFGRAEKPGGMPFIVFALDAEGVFTASDGEGLAALGLEPGEVVGRSAFEVYRGEPEVLENLDRALSGESFSSVVMVDNTTFRCRYDPLRGAGGEVIGAVGLAEKFFAAAGALLTRRMLRRPSLFALLLLAAVLISGCSLADGEGSSATGGYGNIMQFDGIYYEVNDLGEGVDPEAEGAEPGPIFAKVEARLQGENATREIRNGDAGVLPKGTPVHTVRGYDPSFRLTARMADGRWTLYEAVENPKAVRGEDLFDIGGKVARIEIGTSMTASAGDSKNMAVIEDPQQVQELVHETLTAPVWRGDSSIDGYQVIFRLNDGTAAGGTYAADSGRLSTSLGGSGTGVVLPKETRESIRRILR